MTFHLPLYIINNRVQDSMIDNNHHGGGIIHSATAEPSSNNNAEGITLSVIVGAGGCDLVLPEGQKEAVAFRGEPEALMEWVEAGPWHIGFNDDGDVVVHQDTD